MNIKFKSIYKALPLPCLVLLPDSPKFTIVDINDAFIRTVDMERSKVVGKGFFDVFPAHHYKSNRESENLFLKLLVDGEPNQSEKCLKITGSGQKIVTWEKNTPVHNDKNEIVCIIHTLHQDVVLDNINSYSEEDLLKFEYARYIVELESLERKVLELNSDGKNTLKEVLNHYLSGLERIFPQMTCSVLKVRDKKLKDMVSPSLPADYCASVNGQFIGPLAGSCGSAAYLKERVIVTDISNDVRWMECKDLALKNNLRACWSSPIINSSGNVIATFAVYYNQIKYPEKYELQVIEKAVAIIKILLENRSHLEVIRDTSLLMKQGQEMAHLGIWQWDINLDKISWSESLYMVFGLEPENFKATFDAYIDLIHPEDRANAIALIHNVIETGCDSVNESRIIRPDGVIRHVKSWIKKEVNEIEDTVLLRGACLDITESKRYQEQLQSSEMRLKSLLNAPTHYVLRFDLEGNYTFINKKYQDDFGWMMKNDETCSLNFIDIVQPRYVGPMKNIIKSCVQFPGQVHMLEMDKIHETGSTKTLLWYFVCLLDINNSPSEIQCNGIDISDLKRTEQALKISNDRYEYVNKATNDAIYEYDILQDHIQWGEGFTRIFGYNFDENPYPRRKWAENVHPEEQRSLEHNLDSVLKDPGQQKWFVSYLFRKADCSYACVEESAYITRADDGKALKMIGVMRDITEQKSNQINLIYKSKLLAAIVEVTTSLLYYDDWFAAISRCFKMVGKAADVDRVYYFENYQEPGSENWYVRHMLEWNAFGITPMIGDSDLQRLSFEAIHDFIAPLKENKPFMTQVSQLSDTDVKSILTSQGILSIMVLPIFVKNKFYGFIGFDDCKSERIWTADELSFLKTISANLAKAIEIAQSDKALQDAFNQKNSTLESIQDGFFSVSKDWIVTYWNKEAENMLGTKKEDIVGRNLWEVYADAINSKFHTEYQKALIENVPVRFEALHDRLGIWLEVSAYPLENGLTVYFKDITTRKSAEIKLKELHKELEKHLKTLAISNAELEQFAYVASHDLQEPLRMITGFLTQLERKYQDVLDDKGRKYIYFAVDGAKRMRKIILDLLEFSRIGRTQHTLETFDVNVLIQEISKLYHKKIRDKQAEIFTENLPVIESYRAPIAQVFHNLISNALKYHRADCPPVIKIRSEQTKSHWIFSVEDNGIGISEEYYDRVFVIFQRLHNKDEYSGTGIGLAITKKIIESFGGSISLESKKGEGSCFVFTIAKNQDG
jgi:PAS domain S-box-containing protein